MKTLRVFIAFASNGFDVFLAASLVFAALFNKRGQLCVPGYQFFGLKKKTKNTSFYLTMKHKHSYGRVSIWVQSRTKLTTRTFRGELASHNGKVPETYFRKGVRCKSHDKKNPDTILRRSTTSEAASCRPVLVGRHPRCSEASRGFFYSPAAAPHDFLIQIMNFNLKLLYLLVFFF